MIPIVGYGSLMSARGLGAQLAAVRDLSPFHLATRRVFAKPSQRGGCLAMDVVVTSATLQGRTARAEDSPQGDGFEGILLTVDVEASPALARREGYPPDCWRRLLAVAGARGLPALLLELARDADDDVVAYRRALHALAGPFTLSAVHYLPHPVETDAGPAIVFVAPVVGTTGCELSSAKAAVPGLAPRGLHDLFTLDDTSYPGFDPALQARYVELCLLAACHGIYVGDLLPRDLPDEHPARVLLRRWAQDPEPLRQERAGFESLVGAKAYASSCGDTLDTALARSGLRL